MATYNTWLPGNAYYTFNTVGTHTTERINNSAGVSTLVETFGIPDFESGVGIVATQISPPFNLTVPPKIAYRSGDDMTLLLKDSDGWFWAAKMPAQPVLKERGWKELDHPVPVTLTPARF